jgi:hypothetical protein
VGWGFDGIEQSVGVLAELGRATLAEGHDSLW